MGHRIVLEFPTPGTVEGEDGSNFLGRHSLTLPPQDTRPEVVW